MLNGGVSSLNEVVVLTQLARNHCCNEFGVCCSPRTTTSDIISNEMYLFAAGGNSHRRTQLQAHPSINWLLDRPTFKDQGMGRRKTNFLSATIGPSVARVSAPRHIPPSQTKPTIVVPVLVALGSDSLEGPEAEVR